MLLLFLAILLAWPRGATGTIDFRVMGLTWTNNGALLVSVVLTNTTSHTFDVLGDAAGKPAFILDTGSGYTMLAPLADQLRFNLAAGASLDAIARLTNPPSRFRLKVEVHDLVAEARPGPLWPVYRVLPKDMRYRLYRWESKNWPEPSSASEWIVAPDHIVGVGMELSQGGENGPPKVKTVLPAGPADRAGVQAGWILLSVNGTNTVGRSLSECLNLVRGEEGMAVRLELADPAHGRTNEITLTRVEILAPPRAKEGTR